MNKENVRLIKLVTQEAVMIEIVEDASDHIIVSKPSLVFAEQTPTGGTKISYVPWVPFYKNQERVNIRKDTIVTGLYEEVQAELVDRYVDMVTEKKIVTPKHKIITSLA